jgi:RNA polymerase sigma-70 factor (ECF subfamily)
LTRLWRFAVVLSGDRETANDLVQAACARAIEKEAQFIPGSRLDLWTFSILASVWKNQLRAAAVRRGSGQVSAEEALTGDLSIELETTITTRQVLTAVGRLPEAHRSAVLLVYVEGCSYRQAAETLEIPVGTLMSRLAAAKTGLSRTLTRPDLEREAHHD